MNDYYYPPFGKDHPEQGSKDHPGFMTHFVPSGKRRAYVDKDGVCADYHKAREESGLTFAEFNTLPGAFANLPMFPGTVVALDWLEIQGFEVFILTRPVPHPQVYGDKAQWVYRNLPRYMGKLIVTPDKGCIGAPGDIIIDDHPEWGNCGREGVAVIKHTCWDSTLRSVEEYLRGPTIK